MRRPKQISLRVFGSGNVNTLLVVILVLAFLARLAVMILFQTWVFPNERAFGFEEGEIAYALAHGQGFSWPQTWRPVGPPGAEMLRDHPVPTTWKAPIYPMIIGAVFRLFGSYTVQAAVILELFQILQAVLTCYVLFQLGKLLFNEWTGLLAALMFALYPSSIHFSLQKIEYGPLLTLLGLVMIWQTLKLSELLSITGSALLGVVSGVAMLVNPVIVAFYPFGLLWLLGWPRNVWRTRVKYAVVIIGCCAGVMTPWLIRNYLVFNQFVFIRPNFSREFVSANYPEDASALVNGNPIVKSNDGLMSTLFTQTALSLVVERPARLLQATARRVPQFWTYMGENEDDGESKDSGGNKDRLRFIAGAAYGAVLCFGLAGAWAARRELKVQLLIIYLLAMPLPFYLTWAVRGRFRFPIEPILILFAAYALTSLLFGMLLPLRTPMKSAQ